MGWQDGLKKFGLGKKKEMPGGLWTRCEGCQGLVYRKALEENLEVCPQCQFHNPISARARIALLLDEGCFREHHAELESGDPLGFNAKRSYRDRLREAQERTGMREACLVGEGAIEGRRVIFGVTDPAFLMGSMGSVVGEKVTRAIETALAERIPFVFVSGSGGGARMDEGVLSLMQMAKTCAALARFDQAGGFFLSILTNPTMGGVMASFAALGDVVVAEPGALIGFAGPQVIKNTLKVELPEGFQRSEFLLEHGFLDAIVPRAELRTQAARLLRYCEMG